MAAYNVKSGLLIMKKGESDMTNVNLLKSFHVKGEPLILFNVWDAGSAKAAQEIGSKAIATSSWSVAQAHGYEDGEQMPFNLVLANAQRIVKSVDLPVTIDFEGGYGATPEQVQKTVETIAEVGVAGVNIEDQIIGGAGLYSCDKQCGRIRAAAKSGIFINARTDIFLKAQCESHSDDHLEEALHRASAYAEAGAGSFFVPGLVNETLIIKLCALSPIPINVMIAANSPKPKRLAELGASRISYGLMPYCHVMEGFKEAASRALIDSAK